MTNQDSNIPLNIDVPDDPEYRRQTAEALNPSNILLKRFRRPPGAMIGMVVPLLPCLLFFRSIRLTNQI